jgi:excisionase family DNA binding protein
MSHELNHAKMAYTIEEATSLLSLSRAQLYRLIDRGELATIKIGKSRRVTAGQLEAFLLRFEQEQQPISLSQIIAARPRTRKERHV